MRVPFCFMGLPENMAPYRCNSVPSCSPFKWPPMFKLLIIFIYPSHSPLNKHITSPLQNGSIPFNHIQPNSRPLPMFSVAFPTFFSPPADSIPGVDLRLVPAR